jgi:hypothetical protein
MYSTWTIFPVQKKCQTLVFLFSLLLLIFIVVKVLQSFFPNSHFYLYYFPSKQELLVYAITISANALAVKNENKKIENAKLEKAFAVVKKMLLRGKATIEEIAEDCDVIVDFVLDVQSQLSDK